MKENAAVWIFFFRFVGAILVIVLTLVNSFVLEHHCTSFSELCMPVVKSRDSGWRPRRTESQWCRMAFLVHRNNTPCPASCWQFVETPDSTSTPGQWASPHNHHSYTWNGKKRRHLLFHDHKNSLEINVTFSLIPSAASKSLQLKLIMIIFVCAVVYIDIQRQCQSKSWELFVNNCDLSNPTFNIWDVQ